MRLIRRAAVLGKPVAHSLSPVIHRAGYEAAGLAGWSYAAIECGEADLPGLVAGLGPEWAGLSLTMPLKEVALTVADQVAPLAADLGAANTLVRLPDDTWRAENTDAPGIAAALTGSFAARSATPGTGEAATATAGGRRLPAGTAMVVLGAGGTARAALGAAARLGIGEVSVVARRPAALSALDPVAAVLGLRLRPGPWEQAAALLATADLVVSTVPSGAAEPLAGQVAWRPGAVLLDALYHPWPTPLAAAAAAAGVQVASGRDLLLAQAVEQFRLFTGVPAPVDAMCAALAAA